MRTCNNKIERQRLRQETFKKNFLTKSTPILALMTHFWKFQSHKTLHTIWFDWKFCSLAFATATCCGCCEMELELRRDWLRFWEISAGQVMLVRLLTLTVFALVQSLSRLFATFPLVLPSVYVFVVSWSQTLLSRSRWQSLPNWRKCYIRGVKITLSCIVLGSWKWTKGCSV